MATILTKRDIVYGRPLRGEPTPNAMLGDVPFQHRCKLACGCVVRVVDKHYIAPPFQERRLLRIEEACENGGGLWCELGLRGAAEVVSVECDVGVVYEPLSAALESRFGEPAV